MRISKIGIVFVGIFLVSTLSLHADWEFVTGGYLSNVQFVGNNGWATDNYGRIRHTSDGGAHWGIQESGVTSRLYGVSFVDSLKGWISGSNGVIVHTTDGGATWTPQTSGTSNRLDAIFFLDSLNGWAGGSYGTLLHTIDGGTTWDTLTVTVTTYHIYTIFFVDSLHGWVTGSKHIYYTSDGGINWTEQTNPAGKTIYGTAFTDTLNGWAVTSLGHIIHTTDGGATWTEQTSGTSTSLYTIAAGDSLHLWAAGLNGVILHTNDGGTTWNPQGFSLDWFWGSYFADTLSGWLVGAGGAIFHTTDGGVSWVAQTDATTSGLRRTTFVDENHVWGSGNNGTIIGSNDGGLRWDRKTVPFTSWIYGIDFADTLHGWAACYHDTILSTTDGGETWTAQTSGTGADLIDVSAVNDTMVWIVGKDGVIIHSNDGGSTWATQTSGVSIDFKSVEFLTENIGWAVGASGTILYTNDGGANWTAQTSGVTSTIYDVSFVDTLNGWVDGSSGVILHTTDGGATWTAQTSGVTYTLTRIVAIDSTEAWAVGLGDYALHTTDGGVTWVQVSIPCTIGLWGLDFANANLGIAMGNGGIVTRYTYMPPDIAVSPDTVVITAGSKYQRFSPVHYENTSGNYSRRVFQIDKEPLPVVSVSQTTQQSKGNYSKAYTPDTLYYDDGTMESALGIQGATYTPTPDETYGFATKFDYTKPTYLLGVMIYFGSFNGTDYRLYVWGDNAGVPASGATPLYVDLNMPTPTPNAWNYIDLSDSSIFLPPNFWLGICYNSIVTPSDWYLGYDNHTADHHTYINLNGDPGSWEDLGNYNYAYPYGVRAIVAQEGAVSGNMMVYNVGIGELQVTDINSGETWIKSTLPASFNISPGDSQSVLIEVDTTGLANGIYYGSLHIVSNDPDENPYDEPVKLTVSGAGIEDNNNTNVLWLSQNYPNPVRNSTTIRFAVPKNTRNVKIKIYNISGRLVKTLIPTVDRTTFTGIAVWNGTNENNRNVANGVYFYRLVANGDAVIKKMLVIR
ncbi:T9SS type A sorting domain-containing protein [candidate division WOR-3 bacterium]|nr:T9SS type A sorting domain-containing protein [candidate division WOR-3 bacterium]